MTTSEIVPLKLARGLAATARTVPSQFVAGPKASERFWEFFTANIGNKNMRRACYKAACRFSERCESRGLRDLGLVKPIRVAAYFEELLQGKCSAPRVKTIPWRGRCGVYNTGLSRCPIGAPRPRRSTIEIVLETW